MNFPITRQVTSGVRYSMESRFPRILTVGLLLVTVPSLFSQLTFDFNANDGGFSVVSNGPVESFWTYGATAGVGGNGAWFVNGTGNQGTPSNSALLSPTLYVASAGSATISFNHRFNFEDSVTAYDGGQLQVSVNGGAFTTVPGSAFTSNGYTGTIVGHGVLDGLSGFTATSSGYGTPSYINSTATLGTFLGGETLRIKFLGAWDEYTLVSSPNWMVDDISFSNVAVPEPHTYALVSGLVVLGLAAYRRRIRSDRVMG